MHVRVPVLALIAALGALTANAKSELQQYVEQCEKELGFSARDIHAMNCNDGEVFANTGGLGQINDYMLYQRVNDKVDYVVACRWLKNHDGYSNGAASVEAIIHNRSNAETCFFSAIEGTNDKDDTLHNVSVEVVSPTDFNNSNADNYWLSPTDLDSKQLFDGTKNFESARCVGCHVAGPYIASPPIAPYLAKYGLLNNGHDTFADMSNTSKHYHAVGSIGKPPYNNLPTTRAFEQWDSYIAQNNVIYKSGSCNGCHAIADNSTVDDLTRYNEPVTMLSAIRDVIALIRNSNPPIMPPTNDPYSDYRWINRDTANGSGEYELLKDMKIEYPKLVCDNATELQAHVVGSDYVFSTADPIPDQLNTFSVQEGLVCVNSDQSNGQCNDYKLRYLCNGSWTKWINNDSPLGKGKGDYERRSDPAYKNVCSDPTEMQARTTVTNWVVVGQSSGVPILGPVTSTLTFNAPHDRLYGFGPQYGLGCYNSDQPSGQCSNYVVRFICQN